MIKKAKALMCTDGGAVLTSSLMNAVMEALKCVSAQPMVQDIMRAAKEFMTKQVKQISSNDLLNIMKNTDERSSAIDLNLVMSCLKHCGEPPVEFHEHIDAFLVRCITDVMNKERVGTRDG